MPKIPLFIPNKIKQELHEMGFDETFIKYMKPKEAWEIIEGRMSKTEYILKKINEEFTPKLQEELNYLNSLSKKELNKIKQEMTKKNFMNELLNDNLTIN